MPLKILSKHNLLTHHLLNLIFIRREYKKCFHAFKSTGLIPSIKKVSFSFNNSNSYGKSVLYNIVLHSRTYLSKPVKYSTSQRTMMRYNTPLTTHQIKAYSRILYYHNNFLRNVVDDSQKNENNFIEYALIAITAEAKVFQHFLSIAYPNKTYSYMLLSKKFPEIFIDNGDKALLNNATLITTLQTALLKKQEIFKLADLKAIMAREDQIILHKNSKEFQDTGQQNPDAEYIYIYTHENKTWKLHRFIDFKSGDNYGVNNSNILGTSDKNYYEKLSKKLMLERRTCFEDNFNIKLQIENLRQDNTLSWGERNNILQKYFMDHAFEFPEIKPTFLFYHPDLTSFVTNSSKKLKLIEGLVSTNSMSNLRETEIVIARILFVENSNIINNYKFVEGHNQNIVDAVNAISKQGIQYLTNTI